MPIPYKSSDGHTYVIDEAGWHEASPHEMAAIETPAWQAVMAQGVRKVQGYGSAMESLLNAGARSFGGEGGGLGGMPNNLTGPVSTQSPLGDINRTAAANFAPLEGLQPGAAALGSFINDPMTIAGAVQLGGMAGRFIGGMGTAAPQRMADRVAAGIGAAAEESGGGSQFGRNAEGLVQPGGNPLSDVNNMWDEITQPVPLSAQQAALVPEAERLGIKLPQSKISGTPGVSILEEQSPFGQIRLARDAATNQSTLGGLAVRAMGLPEGTPMTFDAIGSEVDAARDVLDGLAVKANGIEVPAELAKRLERLGKVPDLALDLTTEPGVISGEQAMSLHSQLTDVLRARHIQPGVFNLARDAQAQLDGLIEKQLGPVDSALWSQTLQQYKARIAIEGSFNEAGQIQINQLGQRLRSMYRGAYGREVLAGTRSAGLTPATSDLLQAVKVLRAFPNVYPNSGTALRQAYGQMLSHPLEAAKDLATHSATVQFVKGIATRKAAP